MTGTDTAPKVSNEDISKAITVVDEGDAFVTVSDDGLERAFKIPGTAPIILSVLEASIREKASSLPDDMGTEANRSMVRSFAYRIARSKTLLDTKGKNVVDSLKALPRIIDANRKVIRDRLDAVHAEVRKPLTKWEDDEAERKRQHTSTISWLAGQGDIDWIKYGEASIRNRIAEVSEFSIPDDAAEFGEKYAETKKAAIVSLDDALAARVKFDTQNKELERLRQEAEARRVEDLEAEKKRAEAERLAEAEKHAAMTGQSFDQNKETPEPPQLSAETAALAARVMLEDAENARRQAHDHAMAITGVYDISPTPDTHQPPHHGDAEWKAHRAGINRAALRAFVSNGIEDAVARRVIELIVHGKIPAITLTY
ncbi:MAG: hypothetical protein KDI55_00140 [Anaerolineae bacterium]|nr:hypothetical protein [Anaerolineae bacterium]